jgi:hypothetical protein
MALDKSHPEAGFVEFEPVALAALDLVMIIVALLCVIVAFAFWVVLYVLDKMFGGISFFGFHPFQFAFGLINDGMKASLGLLDSQAYAFGELIFGIVQTVWRFAHVAIVTVVTLWWRELFDSQSSSGNTAAEAARAKAAESQILNQEQGDLNGLRATVGQAVAGLEQQEAQDVASLERQLQQVAASVPGDVSGQLAQLGSELAATQASLQGEITGLGNSLQSDIAHVADSIPSDLAQLQAQLQSQINAGVGTAEAFATGAATGAGAAAVASVLAILQPQVNAITTELGDCLDPLCDTVTPQAQRLGNLGRFLQSLEELGLAALLIALAAEAVHDPAAVVSDVTTVVQDAGDATLAAFRDLIGV